MGMLVRSVLVLSTFTLFADAVPSIVFQKPVIKALTRFTTDSSGRLIAVGSASGCVAATNGSVNSSTQFSVSLDGGATWQGLSSLPCDQEEQE